MKFYEILDHAKKQIYTEPMHEISRLKTENMSLCYRLAYNHNHIQYCYTAVKPKPIGGE